ncbi:MAG: thiamine pyrophosphate-dependent enzyme [bacterium]
MTERFLVGEALPFCGGCGHESITRSTAAGMAKAGLDPHDVVLVTDIGCHGIIDRFFRTHTVHGLHGRSVALGAGISAGMGRGRVVVFVGDGGAVIGLQHLVEAAARNFALTVIVHNNMLYGMTGGQPSSVTPEGFRTGPTPQGKAGPGYDLCRILHAAGAAYCRRVAASGDFSDAVAEALGVPGFALLEVMELCPSYGVRHNPGRKLADIARDAGLEFETLRNPDRAVLGLARREGLPSLLDVEPIAMRRRVVLSKPFTVLVSGSAGGGVQKAAELLARAAVAAGLHASKQGFYPVTVGTGYSAAEVIISPQPVLYTGIEALQAAVVTSPEGLAYSRSRLAAMAAGAVLVIDEALELPETTAEVWQAPFARAAGPRGAALAAVAWLMKRRPVLPVEYLAELSGPGPVGRGASLAELLAKVEGAAGTQT